MITTNPFAELASNCSFYFNAIICNSNDITCCIGTFMDILHKKNVKYFFQNAKKAKNKLKENFRIGEKTSIYLKQLEVIFLQLLN